MDKQEKRIAQLEKEVSELKAIINNTEFLKDTFGDTIVFKKKIRFLNKVYNATGTAVIN